MARFPTIPLQVLKIPPSSYLNKITKTNDIRRRGRRGGAGCTGRRRGRPGGSWATWLRRAVVAACGLARIDLSRLEHCSNGALRR